MKKMLLPALGVLIGFALVATATYAWFSATVNQENVKDQVVTTGTLELTYTDGTEIKLENARPGATATKTITVKNTGTLDTSYNLVWQVLKNEITNDEMVMSATCERLNKAGDKEENCEGLDETPITKNMVLKGVDIPSGYSHRYTVTVTFKEIGAEQNYNQGKNFIGVLGVDEYKEATPVYCTFDGELEQGTTFTKGIYTYSYKQGGRFNPMAQGLEWHDMDENGWGVQLNDKTSTTPITEVPCTYINNIPIVNTSSMFAMSKATSIDLSNFNTSNVVYMVGMFIGAYATTLDLSSFDTSKVTNMDGMFNTAKASTINVTSFDTSNVTSMASMFGKSSVENIIGLENFDTSKVTTMEDMFNYTKVTSLNLSSFDTSKVTDMSNMFGNCKSLKSIYVSDKFNVSNVTSSDSMFQNDTNLEGGNGTAYDSTKVDKTYARIDTAENPGYFTAKQ